jgi:hypothetical protein
VLPSDELYVFFGHCVHVGVVPSLYVPFEHLVQLAVNVTVPPSVKIRFLNVVSFTFVFLSFHAVVPCIAVDVSPSNVHPSNPYPLLVGLFTVNDVSYVPVVGCDVP